MEWISVGEVDDTLIAELFFTGSIPEDLSIMACRYPEKSERLRTSNVGLNLSYPRRRVNAASTCDQKGVWTVLPDGHLLQFVTLVPDLAFRRVERKLDTLSDLGVAWTTAGIRVSYDQDPIALDIWFPWSVFERIRVWFPHFHDNIGKLPVLSLSQEVPTWVTVCRDTCRSRGFAELSKCVMSVVLEACAKIHRLCDFNSSTAFDGVDV